MAGERQRGTLEVLLARPVSRRRLYVTLLVATILFVAVAMAAQVLGTIVGLTASGALADVQPERLAIMWLNGVVVFAAFGAFALAASVSFDRLTPALGLSLAFVLVSYFLEIIGSLWIDARGLQPYSLFHYLDPKGALNGSMPSATGSCRSASSWRPSWSPGSSSRGATWPPRADAPRTWVDPGRWPGVETERIGGGGADPTGRSACPPCPDGRRT